MRRHNLSTTHGGLKPIPAKQGLKTWGDANASGSEEPPGRIPVQDGSRVDGPIKGAETEPLYLDVRLPVDAVFRVPLPPDRRAFIYV